MEETNDGLKIILSRLLYDLSITIYPLYLTRNKATEKMRMLLNGPTSSRSNSRMGMKEDEMAQHGLAACCFPNLYVYLQCNTAFLDFVHGFVFRTEYSISETRSVFDLTLKFGDVPSQLCPLDGCTGVSNYDAADVLVKPSGSRLFHH
jgi:hypothetical protein